MFADDDPLRVEYIDGRRWRLLENFTYIDDRDSEADRCFVDVPGGFVTDFASVPRGLWNLAPPDEFAKPAVIHDWLYFKGSVVSSEGDVEPITRMHADAIFRRALADTGVGKMRRWILWSAVRTGGGSRWQRYRAQDASDR